MRLKNFLNTGIIISSVALLMGGCSSVQEALSSQMEVPTLEKQANRVAVGMMIVRENNIMARKFAISAEAKWPKEVTKELTKTEELQVKKVLLDDPYFSTVNYTEPIQRKELGSSALMNQLGGYGQIAATMLNQTITPLMYRAFYKIIIFYGEDKKNWPNIFAFDRTSSNFEEFEGGKLREPDLGNAQAYDNITEAMISLMPVNLQKDVELAKNDMLEAYGVVLELKSEEAEIETELKTDEARKSGKKQNITLKGIDGIETDYTPLTQEEVDEKKQRLSVLKEEISNAEKIADEKEQIYFELIDKAAIALQSDINLDDKEYIKLAENVNMVANDVQDSATEAYASFGIAAGNIAANNTIQNFPKELKTLALAKAYIPLKLQDKYNQRIKRLVSNTMYILPNMIMGTYYAHKQSVLAEKYADFTDIILEAYNTKLEQESKANSPKEDDIKKQEAEAEKI